MKVARAALLRAPAASLLSPAAAPLPKGTRHPSSRRGHTATQPLVMIEAPCHTRRVRYAHGTTVGDRGQITIEKAVRDTLGIRARDIAVQRVENGRLVVTFLRPAESHRRSLAGVLGPPPRRPPADETWETAVEDEIAADWDAGQPHRQSAGQRERSGRSERVR